MSEPCVELSHCACIGKISERKYFRKGRNETNESVVDSYDEVRVVGSDTATSVVTRRLEVGSRYVDESLEALGMSRDLEFAARKGAGSCRIDGRNRLRFTSSLIPGSLTRLRDSRFVYRR